MKTISSPQKDIGRGEAGGIEKKHNNFSKVEVRDRRSSKYTVNTRQAGLGQKLLREYIR